MAHAPLPALDRANLARGLTEHLVRGATVECELGTFFTTITEAYMGRNPRTGGMVPVPPKRLPRFVPSDALLRAIGGEAGAAGRGHYLAELAKEASDTHDVEDDRIDDDDEDGDPEPVAGVPPITDRVVLGPLFDELATALGSKRKLAVPSLGTFRRFTVRRGEHRGRVAVSLTFSQVLKAALNPR